MHGGNFCPIRFLGASKPMKTQTFANRQFFCSTVFEHWNCPDLFPAFLRRTVEIAKLPESQNFLIGIWGRKTRSVWSSQQHRVLASHTMPICKPLYNNKAAHTFWFGTSTQWIIQFCGAKSILFQNVQQFHFNSRGFGNILEKRLILPSGVTNIITDWQSEAKTLIWRCP